MKTIRLRVRRTVLVLSLLTSSAWAIDAQKPVCGKNCFKPDVSIVNAAGLPDATLRGLIGKLQFKGDALAAADDSAVRGLAAQARNLAPGQRLVLAVMADSKVDRAQAQRQMEARARSLLQALISAGAPQDSIEIQTARRPNH